MNEVQSGIDFYRLFEVIGVWLAAFATFFAARVALRIARRQDEVRLKISIVDAIAIDDSAQKQVVWITITNVARRRAIVRTIGWKMSPFCRTELYQKIDHPNPQLPIKLEDGEVATVVFDVNRHDREDWYEMMAEAFMRFGKPRRMVELRFFRLQVFCSTGELFLMRPNKSFFKKLRDAIDVLEHREKRTEAVRASA